MAAPLPEVIPIIIPRKKHVTPCWGIGHLCLALLLGHLVSNPTGGCRLLITCRKVVGGSGETSEDIKKNLRESATTYENHNKSWKIGRWKMRTNDTSDWDIG